MIHICPNIENVVSVQNIMNKIPTYASLNLSFSANTWANMVDPSNIGLLGKRG